MTSVETDELKQINYGKVSNTLSNSLSVFFVETNFIKKPASFF